MFNSGGWLSRNQARIRHLHLDTGSNASVGQRTIKEELLDLPELRLFSWCGIGSSAELEIIIQSSLSEHSTLVELELSAPDQYSFQIHDINANVSHTREAWCEDTSVPALDRKPLVVPNPSNLQRLRLEHIMFPLELDVLWRAFNVPRLNHLELNRCENVLGFAKRLSGTPEGHSKLKSLVYVSPTTDFGGWRAAEQIACFIGRQTGLENLIFFLHFKEGVNLAPSLKPHIYSLRKFVWVHRLAGTRHDDTLDKA